MIVPLANSEETKRPKSKAIVESQIRYATLHGRYFDIGDFRQAETASVSYRKMAVEIANDFSYWSV